jgi:flagellar hook-associated protein 2
MSTVGLNFGSATSGQGFDVATTVKSITALTSSIETPWKTQLTTLASQNTALTTIGSDLSSLSTAIAALTNFTGVTAVKQGSSSDTNVLTLTAADATATAGSHTIVVNSLASTASNYTDPIAAVGDTLSGSLSIKIGTGTTASSKTITIDSTTNTLAKLALAINDGSFGVSAEVVTDANGSRLLLASNQSGAVGALTLSGTVTDATTSKSLAFHLGQVGADASLTVDGLPTTSASNTVTHAIKGVTFQLISTGTPTTNASGVSSNEQIQVQITNANANVETAVQTFVTAYNTVMADVKAQEGTNGSGVAEPLYGDPTLSLIQSQLASSLFGGTASGTISNVYQLGITANSDGTLSFTSTTLDAILNTNYSDVVGFFQNTGSWGAGLSRTLDTLGTTAGTGAIALEIAQNSTQESALNTNISNEESLIATETKNLTTELNLANEELQAIPQQLSEINQTYSAITGYNQNSNG